MGKKISDKSRQYSQIALQHLQAILCRHPVLPDAGNLSEEENAWLSQRIIQFGNAVAATNYQRFSFYKEAVRVARNSLAHATEMTAADLNKIYKSFFAFASRSEVELSENIGRAYSQSKALRMYEKFGALGTEADRKLFVDVLRLEYSASEQETEVQFQGDDTQRRLFDAAKSVLRPQDTKAQELLEYARSMSGLEDSIQEEIIRWTEQTAETLGAGNPFAAETALVSSLAQKPSAEIQGVHASVLEDYYGLVSVRDFPVGIQREYYLDAFRRNEAAWRESQDQSRIIGQPKQAFPATSTKALQEFQVAQKEFEERAEVLCRNLLGDMQKELERRHTEWELNEIERARQELLALLYEKIEKFKKIQEMLSSFIEDFGRLWDMARGNLNDCGFEILEQYADLLQNDEGLQELSKMIGRHHTEEQKFRKELRSKVVVETIFNPEPAFKGEISGLKLGNDIPDIIPSEIALYSNPQTRPIFKLKYAQKQLLSFNYTRNIEYCESHNEQEEIEVGEKTERKGPMIICVDTSGSMKGPPERVAKTVTFALAKSAIEEERKCYLVSFSTGIETLDLSDFTVGNPVENLVAFLRMNFNGGTDATPALSHSLEKLSENHWENADVLMVSDFVMDSLPPELTKKIKVEQGKETCFYSLVIGNSGNEGTIACFDHNWAYHMDDPNASRRLVEQIHRIKTRATSHDEQENPAVPMGLGANP